MGPVATPPVQPDWLAQLAPAHVPPPIGWWPLAPGWWALLVLLIAIIAGICVWYRRHPQRLRRGGLRELAKLEATTVDDAALARALVHLVRRYAVARWARSGGRPQRRALAQFCHRARRYTVARRHWYCTASGGIRRYTTKV